MDSLFNKINCDRSAITDMLGGTSGVTDANMMQVVKEFAVFFIFHRADLFSTRQVNKFAQFGCVLYVTIMCRKMAKTQVAVGSLPSS